MFARDRTKTKKRKRWATVILLSLAYVLIEAVLVYVAYIFGSLATLLEVQSELLTLLFIIAIFVVFVFGVVAVLNNLYFSRDTEFFSALPIKPVTIYAAKLFVVYACETVLMAAILLPCAITAAAFMKVSVLFYVLLPFMVVLMPCIPLFFAAIIAVPVMYIVSFFKKRGAAGSIAAIMLVAAFFVGYYLLMMRFQKFMETEDPLEVLLKFREAMQKVCKAFYPVYVLVKGALLLPFFGLSAGASAPIGFLIFLGCVAVMGALSVLLSVAVYRRGAAAVLEGAAKAQKKNGSYKTTGLTKAIFVKEWRELVRTPAFAFQCLFGVVMCPLLLGFSAFMTMTNGATFGGVTGDFNRLIYLWFILAMGAGMNVGASTAFTREGEKFCYCKLLPVSAVTLVKAKSFLYMLVGAISSLLGFTVLCILAFDVSFLLLGIPFLVLYLISFVHFGMFFDLSKPKLDWKTPNEAVKHSANAMVPMFANMGFSLALIVAAFVAYYFLGDAGCSRVVCLAVSWSILYACVLAVGIPVSIRLYRTCQHKLDRISV